MNKEEFINELKKINIELTKQQLTLLEEYYIILKEENNSLKEENQKLNDEILKLKQDLRDASIQTEIAKASPSNTSNLDILKRLSNLEKIIYGHSEKEEKEE